jgi:hypothetical protein
MASIIRIKRSSTSGNPATLGTGELAYSNKEATGAFAGSGDRLYIGMGAETAGNAATHVVIGGKYFTDKLDHTPGTLTANSAIIVDDNSKINELNVDNLTLNGNTISSTNADGNIEFTPDGDGYVKINGTNALVIPKGTSLQQAPAVSGAIRFNTDNTAFEGYDGTNWSSLGGVKSVDGLTYIKAEATPGASDDTLYFYSNDTQIGTWDGTKLDIKNTTAATSKTTGALVVAGGVGISGDLYVDGLISIGGGLSSDSYKAANGVPTGDGDTGFTFKDDSGYDTGMFSTGDGQLSLYSNDDIVLDIQSGSDVKLNSNLKLGSDGWQVIGQTSSTFFVQPNTDDAATKLEFTLYSSDAVQLASDGGYGLLLGNVDSSDSYINIGGVDGSYWNSPDDIAIKAMRNGIIALRTNNNDIVLQNDSGSVTFRNSDGHLVIPGTIETADATGDVILAASNGTEKNAVFTGAGYLTLPNVGIQFKDSNNIGGTTKGELAFDGNDIYLDSYTGNVTIWASDTSGWTFNYNSNNPYLQLPGGQLYTVNGNVVLGNNAQIEVVTSETGRVVLGSYSAQQTGQGDFAVAVGYDAGKTDQSNHSVAIGYQAGQTTQAYKSVAIGDMAGNDSQGFLSVAIGANAGLTSQANSAVAVGHSAGRVNQSADATAIGNIAGENDQGFGAVAVGQRAGETSQGQNAVAIGSYAGNTGQGLTAIAIGENAADTNQGFSAIALGRWAGEDTQGQKAIAIGRLAGRFNQSGWAVAIGHHAGMGISGTSYQGVNAIAIGAHAGEYSQHDNSIVLQATADGNGTGINPTEAGLFIDPVRQVNSGTSYVMYDESTKEVTYNSTNIEISGSTIYSTDVGTDANVVLEPLGAGYVSASNAQIKNVAEPTADTDAATKYYVDAARSGLDVKQSVRLATTVDIALTGVKTIDTKTTVTGNRILVKNQDTAADNGIYIANDSGAWTRATDFDEDTEVTSGAFTFVEDGSVNLNAGFVVTTKDPIDVGTTEINWTLFSASGTLIAGDGLSKDGYTLKVNVAATGGIEISDDSLQLKSTVAGNGLSLTAGVLDVGGTTNRISVDGSSVDIDANYIGQSSITTLGTITTGVWNGTAIADTYVANDLTISGGTVDNTPIGGTTRSSAAFTTLAANNLVTFTDTTEAGPLGTGSVVMSGGLSVAKKIYVGGNLTGAGADTSVLSGFDIDGGTY